jgi:pimeloyl-ACP methyl ester carboxylesterase
LPTLYLDLAAELGLEDAVLVGADLGGWIAAEMMVRSTARFSCLVLVAPLGIKLRGRDERDIADMHGIGARRISAACQGRPGEGRGRLHRAARYRIGGDRVVHMTGSAG